MNHLLPPNATKLEKNLTALTRRAGDLPVDVGALWNPMTCPVQVLPWLAWSLSVDTWDTTWSEPTKRRYLAQALSIHRRKGTVASVRRALQSVIGHADIVEWFQPGYGANPQPYHFRVQIELTEAGLHDGVARATPIIQAVMPARCRLDRVNVVFRSVGKVVIAGAQFTGRLFTTPVNATPDDYRIEWQRQPGGSVRFTRIPTRRAGRRIDHATRAMGKAWFGGGQLVKIVATPAEPTHTWIELRRQPGGGLAHHRYQRRTRGIRIDFATRSTGSAVMAGGLMVGMNLQAAPAA